MASKEDNGAIGCLFIVFLVVVFFLIKNVIMPWFSANKETIIFWFIGLFLAGTIGGIIFFPLRNQIRKRRFMSRYGKQFAEKQRIVLESQKIVNEVSRELTSLEAEIKQLTKDAKTF